MTSGFIFVYLRCAIQSTLEQWFCILHMPPVAQQGPGMRLKFNLQWLNGITYFHVENNRKIKHAVIHSLSDWKPRSKTLVLQDVDGVVAS